MGGWRESQVGRQADGQSAKCIRMDGEEAVVVVPPNPASMLVHTELRCQSLMPLIQMPICIWLGATTVAATAALGLEPSVTAMVEVDAKMLNPSLHLPTTHLYCFHHRPQPLVLRAQHDGSSSGGCENGKPPAAAASSLMHSADLLTQLPSSPSGHVH